MKKIEEKMCAAVRAHKNFSSVNTQVVASKDGNVYVYLFGNKIYMEVDGKKSFSLAGWNTNTTRSRLNALGVHVSQKNFEPIYKGIKIYPREWYNI